ncbi:MAG TPA: aminotransferase class V-fold PLP-dependent enzyme [Thermomicrobiales bacterium]|nr:aminotransferase class V-fold PLP-dependent enzyme [Thermomicrobiales bacterium]
MIYLDNAATSWPKPQSVYDTLGSFLQEAGANPGRSGHRMAVGAATAVNRTRELLARLLNIPDSNRIVFAANATDALNQAITGLVRPGMRVITTSMEHNSVARPLRVAVENGAEVRKIACGSDGTVDPIDVAQAAADGVDLIVSTHASNVHGAVQPVAELARIAHDAGALLLVDGAQTVGAMPVDVQALDIDLLAFPGHKGLMGPPGTGGLYIGPRVSLQALAPVRLGGTGVNSEEDVQPSTLPARYESGTVNTVGIAALGAGVEFVLQTGVAEIARHEAQLTSQLIAGLGKIPDVHVFEPNEAIQPAAVVSFLIAGWTPADAGAVLDQSFDIACRTGLHCAPDACRTIGAFPGGTIRFSPGWYTTTSDIDTAIGAVAELAANPLELDEGRQEVR